MLDAGLGGPGPLTIETVGYGSIDGPLESEWRTLSRAATLRLPFLDPAWSRVWWRHLAAPAWHRSDTPLLLLARDVSGALVGVAPLMITRRPRRGPAAIRGVQHIGTDANLTEIRTSVIAAGYESAVTGAWMAAVLQRDDWDYIRWCGLVDGSPEAVRLAEASVGTGPVDWVSEQPDCILRLPATWPELRAGLSANTKEAVRKAERNLVRDGRHPVLHVIEGADASDESVARFFALHRARSQAERATPHPDCFATERSRRFLIDLMREPGLQPRIFELGVDGDVVASRVTFLVGGDLYLYFSGYDLSFSRYSVMTKLFVEMMKWAMERGITTVNLSPGLDRSKTRWKPEVVTYRDGVLRRSGARARVAAGALDAVENARLRLRRRRLASPAR